MKFCKTYEYYMNELGESKTTFTWISYRRLKKKLKKCRSYIESQNDAVSATDCSVFGRAVCDETFFPSLLDEMLAVTNFFNKEVRKLLNPPFECSWSNWKHCLFGCSGINKVKVHNDDFSKDVQDLLVYAMVNVIAFRKILKKYDKVHKCDKGRDLKSSAKVKHIEIHQSPWFYELMAVLINLRDKKLIATTNVDALLLKGLSLTFNDVDNPSMSCGLFDTINIDVDLTCPICLDIVFDAVALKCGHILCYTCACAAASVSIVDGLKTAPSKQKCPLCRQAKVYGGANRLEELNILLSRRCPEYWGKRLESERKERLRLTKEHWQSQLQDFTGI